MSRVNRNKLVNYLKNNSPRKVKELQDIIHSVPPRRYEGVDDFKISPGRGTGDSVSRSGRVYRIAYLEEHHKPIEIVRYWRKIHQDMIDRTPSNAIYLATPNKLRNSMKEVLDIEDHFSNRGGSEKAEETKCSLCGDTYTGELSAHMHNDCDPD